MAAGKRGKLKLQTDGRVIKSLDVAMAMEESGNIRDIVTPSATDPEHISPMEMLKEIQPTTFNQAMPSSLPSQPAMSHTAGTSPSRQRKAYRGSTGNAVRRSASTPNVRGYNTADLALASADKRRNKLGYHRISLACGHCRRRKIRCLPAPDDPQQRCTHCIRLKKECSFFPVDQQPHIEPRRPRQGSKSEALSCRTDGSSSSPPVGGGALVPHLEDFNAFSINLPIPAHNYPPPTSTFDISPVTQAPAPYDIYQHQDRPQWEPHFIDNGTFSAGNSTPEDPGQRHWRSPLTSAFPHQFSGPPASSPQTRHMSTSFPTFAPVTQMSPYPAPTRSMSFDQGDNFHSHYQGHFNRPYSDVRRRASEMHPPSLVTNTSSPNTSISEASGTPMSAPGLGLMTPATTIDGVSPSCWTPMSTHSPQPPQSGISKPHDYGTWYSTDSGMLPKVQEEDYVSSFNGEPAIA